MSFLLWTVFFLLVGSAAIAGLSAAPWLPTRKRELDVLVRAIKDKDLRHVYDLGCGDGRILFTLAVHMPSTKFIGIEMSLLPYFAGKMRQLFGRHKNVSIRLGNLFNANLQDADCVITFLLSKAYPRLIAKFQEELADDTLIVIEAWPLPDIKPSQTIKEDGKLALHLYQARELLN